jgi:hypothetical protein
LRAFCRFAIDSSGTLAINPAGQQAMYGVSLYTNDSCQLLDAQGGGFPKAALELLQDGHSVRRCGGCEGGFAARHSRCSRDLRLATGCRYTFHSRRRTSVMYRTAHQLGSCLSGMKKNWSICNKQEHLVVQHHGLTHADPATMQVLLTQCAEAYPNHTGE